MWAFECGVQGSTAAYSSRNVSIFEGSMNDLLLDLSPSILEHSRVQGIHQEAMQLSRRSSVASSVAIRHVSTRFPVVDTACIFRVEF